ncbi:mucin-19-like isoform X2 [Phymastichus coffea]|uniref:mucin-19-like isoform X2 n=1 Tax=Phymastichus coffea TaxID=108790 RepID=UPI00273B2433|nr:mucin-19-like isoform X2 [Phymastichus coffea]
MNRENEEQKPVPQTLCGALQKEANCKCLVLSVLIYGCLAAVTWCRCANVPKIVLDFTTYPIKSTKHVSPCEDGYIYIPVYYERVNSHAASSLYFYDYCGSKDISKELVLDPKIPITKITLSKGFAFSNVRSATEFEEARSRFFAEQEFRDDYMEMREGLDLGCNFGPMTLVSVLGNPWFTRSYVYWCLSALLLSWPLRIIIECNTQYVDYQITKLFGVNYDTPTNIQIHTSASQLSAPGSYMLAPSYSEALLMESAGIPTTATASNAQTEAPSGAPHTDMVPSYSEALLYERAAAEYQPSQYTSLPIQPTTVTTQKTTNCECPCHGISTTLGEFAVSQESLTENWRDVSGANDTTANLRRAKRTNIQSTDRDASCASSSLRAEARICENCLSDTATTATSTRRSLALTTRSNGDLVAATVANEVDGSSDSRQPRQIRYIVREYSEPDLRRNTNTLSEAAVRCIRNNGMSLENIIESGEEVEGQRQPFEQSAPSTSADQPQASTSSTNDEAARSTGAIPKRGTALHSTSNQSVNRVTVNPIAEAVKRLPNSRSTYFCLKSILKQNRRRFTLVTPEELQSLTCGSEPTSTTNAADDDDEIECSCDGCRAELERPDHLRIDKNRPLSCQSLMYKRENSRTLIFASPIQAVCPSDPFGGRNMVKSEHPPDYENALNLPVLTRLRRSVVEREATTVTAVVTTATSAATAVAGTSNSAASASSRVWKHRRNDSQTASTSSDSNTRTALITTTQSGRAETTISIPSYDGVTVPPDLRNSQVPSTSTDERSPFLRLDELATASGSGSSVDSTGQSGTHRGKSKARLTRSLTERRNTSNSRRRDRALRKSLTERVDTECRIANVRRGAHINIETSL